MCIATDYTQKLTCLISDCELAQQPRPTTEHIPSSTCYRARSLELKIIEHGIVFGSQCVLSNSLFFDPTASNRYSETKFASRLKCEEQVAERVPRNVFPKRK